MNKRAQPLIRLVARWIVEDHQAGRLPVASKDETAPAVMPARRLVQKATEEIKDDLEP